MADQRFFRRTGPYTLGELAEGAACEFAPLANPKLEIADVAPLESAGANEISFLDNTKYLSALSASKAGACVLKRNMADKAPAGMNLLFSDNPYYAYALIMLKFYPDERYGGVSQTEQIAKSAEIGEGTIIGAGSVIGSNVKIGRNCRIASNVTITHAIIGDNVIIHPGVRIGQDGFGFAPSPKGLLKVPQLGRVMIGNGVEIGANTCIDRGSGHDTEIGDGTKIDNLVQIAHNVKIGRSCVIVSQVGISGSTWIGDGTMVGGQAGLAGHLRIGRGAKIAAQSGVMKDIPDGETHGGYPAVPIKDWHRSTIAVSNLLKKNKGGSGQ